MKISHNWLQTFFDQQIPNPAELEDLLTFHSSEIEEVVKVGNDTVIDVKVLPDKSAWLMSHRGMAKEISVITGIPMAHDIFKTKPVLSPVLDKININLKTANCDYYASALINGITVGPSPAWLVERITALGQRSINNVVDATNYIMFELGQPLHAFDADKLATENNQYKIGVRNANEDEEIITLTGENFKLSSADMVVVDAVTDSPIAIAGIKGGQRATVDLNTKNILLESAHFERKTIRHTAKNIKLRTDASVRFENGISVGLAPLSLPVVLELIIKIAGGELIGYGKAGLAEVKRDNVAVTTAKINSVLGLNLTNEIVLSILKKFDYSYKLEGDNFTVTPPWERDDLFLAEDLIEEVGRIYGMEHVASIKPKLEKVSKVNVRQYYAEKIRRTLIDLGFSEVFTSSFRSKDKVKIKNALASDKGYLRSRLHDNIIEAITKNIPHRDLLGLTTIKIFEIGTVFDEESESFQLALGVRTGTTYKAKVDDELLKTAQHEIENTLGLNITWFNTDEGVSEFSLDDILSKLPMPLQYDEVVKTATINYQPFSIYPSISRDIAFWVSSDAESAKVVSLLSETAGNLCVRVTLFDTFMKEDKTSLAFRLVFQSKERTLDGSEVDSLMTKVYDAVAKAGWEGR